MKSLPGSDECNFGILRSVCVTNVHKKTEYPDLKTGVDIDCDLLSFFYKILLCLHKRTDYKIG